jgi:hypothetical protein
LSLIGASRRTVTLSDVPSAAAIATHSSAPEVNAQLVRTTARGAGGAGGSTAGAVTSALTISGGGVLQPASNTTAAANPVV